jgi:hypothetical protein
MYDATMYSMRARLATLQYKTNYWKHMRVAALCDILRLAMCQYKAVAQIEGSSIYHYACMPVFP